MEKTIEAKFEAIDRKESINKLQENKNLGQR